MNEVRVRQQVSELGEKFLRRTQSEAAVLGVLIGRVQQGDASVLPEVERMAHKIHGSGAMFGFPAISERAGEIEHLAEHLITADGSAAVHSADTLRQLIDCIAQLARAAEAPAAGSATTR